jgi:aryl-alcohol dehydrogenase-like predicted oxidoreductase
MWGGTDEAAAVKAIEASIDAGISLIDTAPAYGLGRSEEIVGAAISGKRDKVVIATKCGLNWHHGKGNHFFDEDGKPVHRYLGADGIAYEVEQSLRRLGTDHIDLYRIRRRPSSIRWRRWSASRAPARSGQSAPAT